MIETVINISLIICVIVVILCIISMIFLINYHSILYYLYKINVSENKITSLLNEKTDLISRAINIIEKQMGEDFNEFTNFKNIKSSKPDNLNKDELLTITYEQIKKITLDNENLNNINNYKDIITEVDGIDVKLNGLKEMNNTYSKLYNADIKKFPKNIISKIKKYKEKNLYEKYEPIVEDIY